MTTTTNVSSSLFEGLLSLDAYNRGYNPQVQLPAGVNSQDPIGDATYKEDTSAIEAYKNDGFYAIAYDWKDKDGNEKIIISYRGTDSAGEDPVQAGGSDILNGWLVGTGILAAQATDAEAFYKTTTGLTDIFVPAPSNVIFTGHSLGGGLAGLVGEMFGSSSNDNHLQSYERRAA
jgi:hypothetical protein